MIASSRRGQKGRLDVAKFNELFERVERKVIVDDATEYATVGVRWYGNGAFVRDRLFGTEIARKQQWVVRCGDVVYNKLFAWKGSFAVASADVDGHIVSDKFPTYLADPERVDIRYLAYFFKHPSLAAQALRLSKGAAAISKLTLNPPQFWDLQMPLPCLEEQRRVVAMLDAVRLRLEESQTHQEEAVRAARALAAAAARNIIDSTLGERRPLRDLVTIRGGGTPSKGNPLYWDGAIPWFSPKDMKVRELHDSRDHITDVATGQSAAKLLEPGCVLLVIRGMILTHTVPAAVLRVPAAVNQDMKALIPNGSVTVEYLCAVLWAMNGELLELVERSTHDTRRLQTSKLLAFEIPVPAPAVQLQAVEALEAVQAKVAELITVEVEIQELVNALEPAILEACIGA